MFVSIALLNQENKSKTNSKALPFCETAQPPNPLSSVKQCNPIFYEAWIIEDYNGDKHVLKRGNQKVKVARSVVQGKISREISFQLTCTISGH